MKGENGTPTMIFIPQEEETAGIVVIQNDANQLRLEVRLNESGRQEAACISTRTVIRDGKQYFEEKEEGSVFISSGEIILKIVGNHTCYSFFIDEDGADERLVAGNVSGAFLGSETSGGYIGAYIGMFASGGSEERDGYAAFDWFMYKY